MISVLDAAFWEKQFAVTDGDVERLHSYLCECEEPQEAIQLLERVVGHKLQVSHLVDAGLHITPQVLHAALRLAGEA